MFVHKLQTAFDRRLIDDSIGIQQQHIFRICLADGLVVGTGKAHILLVGHEMHLRMLRLQRRHRSVRRVVVHHEDVALDSLKGPFHAHQTLVQQLADVVADNDYADFLGHTNGMQSNRMTPR